LRAATAFEARIHGAINGRRYWRRWASKKIRL
jgi:hypothetical protein